MATQQTHFIVDAALASNYMAFAGGTLYSISLIDLLLHTVFSSFQSHFC